MAKKISPATRKLRGNASGKRMRPALAGVGDLWRPPRWFNAALRDKWSEVLENAPRGLLAGTDRDLLVTWCVACVGHTNAARDLLKEDMVTEYPNGVVVQNPKIIIMNKHGEMMLRLSKVLGFNPASRLVLGSVGSVNFGPAEQIEGSVVAFIDQKPASLAA